MKNMTKLSAYVSFFVGTIVSLFWICFVHIKESKPLLLCNNLFGVDSIAEGTKWALVDPLVIALPASIVTLLLFKNIGATLPQKHIAQCFGKEKV